MNECLVTKLKASVNEALPKLGTVVFKVPLIETSSSSRYTQFITKEGVQRTKDEGLEWEYTINDGGYFTTNFLSTNLGTTIKSSEINKIPEGQSIYIVGGLEQSKLTVECKGKYQAPTIYGYFDEIKEYNNINDIIGYFTGEICIIYNLTSTEPFKGFKGDVSKINDFRCFVGSNLVFTKEMIAPLTNIRLGLNVKLDKGSAIPVNCNRYSGEILNWSRGSRINSSFVRMSDGVSFATQEHITNCLLDMATCSNVNNLSSLGLVFYCKAGTYTPTSEATEAINTLKAAGYSITITGVKY